MQQQPCNNSHATTAMQQQPTATANSNSYAATAKQQQLRSNSQATKAMQQQPPATAMQQQPCSTSQAATAMQQQPSMQLSGGSGCTSRLHVHAAHPGFTCHPGLVCMHVRVVLHCYHDNRSRAKRSMAARWRQNFTCQTGLVCMHVRVVLHWCSNEATMQQCAFKQCYNLLILLFMHW